MLGCGQGDKYGDGVCFEELVRRYSESYNEETGAHFTSRDIIYLMTDLLLADDRELVAGEGAVKAAYDQTMGKPQMLSAMIERITALNSKVEVRMFG